MMVGTHMACERCADVVERPDIPHVVRACESCGRLLKIHEPGEHGIGMKIRKGDQVVLPSSWLTLSMNPLKSVGRLSRYGLSWFAQQIHLEELPKMKANISAEVDKLEQRCDGILRASKLLEDLDIENAEHSVQIVEILKAHQETPEWWAFLTGTFLSCVRDGIEKSDIQQAIWAMACAERCRSMIIFKEHLEEVVWMGQSAKRIIDILRTWDNNQTNSDEGFWQITFRENVYAISQVFASPLVFIKDSAYVGGMNIDKKNAKLVDYLFSLESSREAVLVEIKTPVTALLGTKDRGTFRPSQDLVGAVMQVLDYRFTLMRDLASITSGTGYDIKAFGPKCVVIAGNGAAELTSDDKRRAFEQFRANSKEVEIVTYDEIFRKLEVLANLFSLSKKDPIQ